jgi:Family of unknown function (DUF5677)
MTDASNDILNRHLTFAVVRQAADAASALLTEMVNYGTAVLSRCNHHLGPLPLKPEDRALLVLLRQVLECLDSLQILAGTGTMSGADPVLRAALEAFISICFITGADSESRGKRGRAYMFMVLRQQLHDLRGRQPGTADHTRLIENVKGDKYAGEFVPVPDPQDPHVIATIERALAEPEMAQIAADYDRFVSTSKSRKPKWYQLHDGPANIQQVAKAVNQGAIYEVLYRTWSVAAHAQDVALPTDKDWLRLRTPQGFKVAVALASWIAAEAFRAVLITYRPSEWDDMTTWYNREIRPRREQLEAITIPEITLGG